MQRTLGKSASLLAFALTLALLSVITLSIGCSKKDPIKVGFVGGLTGRMANLGTSGRDGALLAVELKNNSGGIKGRQVKLVIRDDKQDKVAPHRGHGDS